MFIQDTPDLPSMAEQAAIAEKLLSTAADAGLPQPSRVTFNESVGIRFYFRPGTDAANTILLWEGALSAMADSNRSQDDDGLGISTLVTFIFESRRSSLRSTRTGPAGCTAARRARRAATAHCNAKGVFNSRRNPQPS